MVHLVPEERLLGGVMEPQPVQLQGLWDLVRLAPQALELEVLALLRERLGEGALYYHE